MIKDRQSAKKTEVKEEIAEKKAEYKIDRADFMASLADLGEEEKRAAEVRGEHTEAAWGTQIRNYVLHPYKLVKDTRTSYESANPDTILDGDLEGFHQSYLEWRAKK